jgi:UPF0716 protein FxsA
VTLVSDTPAILRSLQRRDKRASLASRAARGYLSWVGPLLLAFTLLPVLELFLLVRIGRVFGAGSTLLYVVAMGLMGILLAKTQGRKVLRAWQAALAEGRVPEEGVLGGVLVLAGALLLVTPGVITDVLGVFFLLPFTRRAIAAWLQRYLGARVAQGQASVQGFDFGFPPRAAQPSSPPRGRVATPYAARRRYAAQGRASQRPVRDEIIDTEGEEV